jgi:hypothetical protein
MLLGTVLLAVLISGCKSQKTPNPPVESELPTLTIANFFDQANTATPRPTRKPTATPDPAVPPFSLREAKKVTLYSDGLNPNWGFIGIQGEDVNPRSRILVYNGLFSLAITPKKSDSQVFFMVREDSDEVYPRPQVHGFQFRLNPGTHPLALTDLAIHILGSQEQVETRDLKELGEDLEQVVFNQVYVYIPDAGESIPPNAWTEVVVWLDDPVTAPQFDYITGLSIARSEAFLQTYFIDDVQLIVAGTKLLPTQEIPTAIVIPTNVPSETPTITPTATRTPVPATAYFTPTPTRTEKPDKPKPPKDTKAPPPPTEPPLDTPPPVEP